MSDLITKIRDQTIKTLAAPSISRNFLPSHSFSLSRKAPMVVQGEWDCPRYFPRKGEKNWRQSCDREVIGVRENIGLTDLSALAKFEITGADARSYMAYVFARDFRLKEGCLCYGVLRDESAGIIDYGICARLGAKTYHLTMNFEAETFTHLRKSAINFDVQIENITTQYAQFSLSGPNATAAMSECFALVPPFMELAYNEQIFVSHLDASGVRGFEITAPITLAGTLFLKLAKCVEGIGGVVYGLEAQQILRMEKGIFAPAELRAEHAHDCLERVGFKPIGAVQKMLAGAVAIEVGEKVQRTAIKGHLATTCFSPTLGHMIGHGVLENGQTRIGDKIRLVDLVRDFDTLCEVVTPVFLTQ